MISHVASVVVPVPDQDAALAFYRDRLGFETRLDVRLGPDFRWIEIAPTEAETTIGLAVPRGGMWRSAGGDTNISLACDDVAAEHARLTDLGVDVDPVLDLPGAPRMFRFRDPFANTLQVVQSQPHLRDTTD